MVRWEAEACGRIGTGRRGGRETKNEKIYGIAGNARANACSCAPAGFQIGDAAACFARKRYVAEKGHSKQGMMNEWHGGSPSHAAPAHLSLSLSRAAAQPGKCYSWPRRRPCHVGEPFLRHQLPTPRQRPEESLFEVRCPQVRRSEPHCRRWGHRLCLWRPFAVPEGERKKKAATRRKLLVVDDWSRCRGRTGWKWNRGAAVRGGGGDPRVADARRLSCPGRS